MGKQKESAHADGLVQTPVVDNGAIAANYLKKQLKIEYYATHSILNSAIYVIFVRFRHDYAKLLCHISIILSDAMISSILLLKGTAGTVQVAGANRLPNGRGSYKISSSRFNPLLSDFSTRTGVSGRLLTSRSSDILRKKGSTSRAK